MFRLIDNAVGAGVAGAACPSKHFIDKINQIWAHLIRFGQN